LSVLVSLAAFLFASCGTIERPSTSPYFADAAPPAKQELRWSNGKLPKSFDPAFAESPPETDVVRAIYQGLAIIDPKTLAPAPAVAEKWSTVEDKTWTFQLRKDAKWTNGKPVTAQDFVRSWNRLALLGDTVAHSDLLKNFARQKPQTEKPAGRENEPAPETSRPETQSTPRPSPSERLEPTIQPTASPAASPRELKPEPRTEPLAVKAEGDFALTVTLETADPDFPKIVANPIFVPVFGDGGEFAFGAPETSIVTNGPFKIASTGKGGLVLIKSESYFGRDSVQLDSVKLVPAESTEDALEAYRTGQVDVVTNSEFEPAALKLLAPYEDFRKVTNGALNLYEFNRARAPFSDRKVREALTIAIERERLTDGELEGTTRPALRFLPFGGKQITPLTQDVDRAKKLFESSGFPNGDGFPVIKLVINRNDTQQRIARAVARMWKQNLNIDTEIILKETAEMAAVRASGDFDLIRRGIVFPSSDAQSNLASIFATENPRELQPSKFTPHDIPPNSQANSATKLDDRVETEKLAEQKRDIPQPVPTEVDALYDLPAIPLYFPTSYSLVKPYVHGFEPNGLDLFPLEDISIDNNWQPKRSNGES
jgi:oligopeptide transport system substrate-binding protein